ncbi:CHC2 zinc finger domain-containing protein [Scatolibacter rhodanostii]|uniref:CHC2 zinc finger domain-containing protein n=1 Tax=Scatolibacter rhodanostii TaxID=2014781 RepID=UPI000C07A014|nr:CHC2 zinc finger domain-containing protein [Scatolibacter rhodanostii]
MAKISVATEIKQQVNMPDIINRYIVAKPRHNRIPCPFHDGEDYNLSYKKGFFKCFVCGMSGDIFKFVSSYFNLTFAESVGKINEDFLLGYSLHEKPSYRDQLKMIERQKALRESQKTKEHLEKEKEDAYWKLFDEVALYEEIIQSSAPKLAEEDLKPQFIEALHNLEYKKYLLGLAESERWGYA